MQITSAEKILVASEKKNQIVLKFHYKYVYQKSFSDVFCMALSPLAYSATQYGDSYPYAVRPAAATTNVTDPVVTSRPFYARGQAPWPPGGPGGGASQIGCLSPTDVLSSTQSLH